MDFQRVRCIRCLFPLLTKVVDLRLASSVADQHLHHSLFLVGWVGAGDPLPGVPLTFLSVICAWTCGTPLDLLEGVPNLSRCKLGTPGGMVPNLHLDKLGTSPNLLPDELGTCQLARLGTPVRTIG